MIRLADGSFFDDQAADAAYTRAQRQGLVKHYAPGLDAPPPPRFPESLAAHLKPKATPGLTGLLFGRMRRK